MEEKTLVNPAEIPNMEEQIHEMAVHNQEQMYEDFDNGILHLRDFNGVKKFKSIRRAIRKGRASVYGEVYPKRPFKNVKAKKGSLIYKERRLYEQLKHKKDKCC